MEMTTPLTYGQQVTLALLPKLTGFSSLAGSLWIAAAVLSSPSRRSRPFHRLLLGISAIDASSSFWLALSTWPIPSGSSALWATGTKASCRTQGFFTQFGIASSFYNFSLSLYYVMVIRWGWKDARIRTIERYLHALPVLWGFCTASAALGLDAIGNAGLWCWLKGGTALYSTLRMALFYGPLWIMISAVSINVALISAHVRRVEKAATANTFSAVAMATSAHTSLATSGAASVSAGARRMATTLDAASESRAERFAPPDEEIVTVAENGHSRRGRISRLLALLCFSSCHCRHAANHDRSHAVASQCFWYACAFYVNWIALSVVRILQLANIPVPFWLIALASACTPMQGLPNFVIYLCPRIRQVRMAHPERGVWWVFRRALHLGLSRPGAQRGASIEREGRRAGSSLDRQLNGDTDRRWTDDCVGNSRGLTFQHRRTSEIQEEEEDGVLTEEEVEKAVERKQGVPVG